MLGLGCWSFGGGSYWGQVAQADVNEVVRCAIDHGCNFFDTAEAYNDGASETALGQAVAGIARDRILIATKVSPHHAAPEKLIEHCEASLRRLQVNYIDLYMVHWPISAHSIRHFTSEPLPIPSVTEAFGALRDLQAKGKIRHIGVANFGVQKLNEALGTGADIVVNQLPYSLLTRAIELEILPWCRDRGIGVVGYMALMQGVLAGRYATLDEIPAPQRRTRHFNCRRNAQCRHGLPGAEAEMVAALNAIRRIAQRHGLSMASISLKWAIAGKGITSSLCGSSDAANLRRNIQTASEALPDEVIEELNRVTRPLLEKLGSSFDYYENEANDRTR